MCWCAVKKLLTHSPRTQSPVYHHYSYAAFYWPRELVTSGELELGSWLKMAAVDDNQGGVSSYKSIFFLQYFNRILQYFIIQLEIRSVERGICPIAKSQWLNCSYNYGRMHCTCTKRKRSYFHFRSKIWRHLRVRRPRFPKSRKNFGDSRTFKADIGVLNICMDFQDLLA